MSAHIIPFAFDDKLVRTMQHDGEPWFVGKDVCTVLDIRNHNDALARLDADERRGSAIATPGGLQDVVLISEAGTFRLIFTSRKEDAERFKRWLAHEVLPALRKTGAYAVPGREQEPEASPADADLNTRLNLLREARLLYGKERARGLWSMLGLPAVPHAYLAGDLEPFDALDAVLSMPVGRVCAHDVLARDLEDDTRRIEAFGLKTMRGGQRFAVASGHPAIVAALSTTEHAGRLARTLARLPGAEMSVQRFCGQPLRCVLLPVALIDERPMDFTRSERPS